MPSSMYEMQILSLLLNLQVKLISAHQAEIQFVRNTLAKIMGSGEDCSGL